MVLKLNEMTLAQLEALIDERVEQKLEEILGDPDEGLEVREEIIEKLKASLAATRRGKRGIPLEQLAKEMGLDLA